MTSQADRVRSYHQVTKHQLQGYAPGPSGLDWDTQPEPFRRYAGATELRLPLVDGSGTCDYGELYSASPARGDDLSLRSLGLAFELALGLSAWKRAGSSRWALRNNPSSGNLHPTEGYLLLWRVVPGERGLAPGLYHYAPHDHLFERRAQLDPACALRLSEDNPQSFGALGLSSILWREEWKYGARAFRYCQHDVGHALAAARFSARVLGWRLTVDTQVSDSAVAGCLGIDRREDLGDAEPEHPDLLAVLGTGEQIRAIDWPTVARGLGDWQGRGNRLSSERIRWPEIAAVLPAVHKGATAQGALPQPAAFALEAAEPSGIDACKLIRQRRSAQRMDGQTTLARPAFERALARTLPDPRSSPFDVFPWSAAVNLVVFVHAVDGLEPGLYLLVRTPERLASFIAGCDAELDWARLQDTALPLLRLCAPADVTRLSTQLSCGQPIAGGGAFSVAMLADYRHTLELEGAWAYRRLYWESGIIGQVLYLEAEAAGLRGTGIGCYFDDEVHRLLGISTEEDAAWQCLYKFTVGGAVEDERLGTEPAYAHLLGR